MFPGEDDIDSILDMEYIAWELDAQFNEDRSMGGYCQP